MSHFICYILYCYIYYTQLHFHIKLLLYCSSCQKGACSFIASLVISNYFLQDPTPMIGEQYYYHKMHFNYKLQWIQ